MALVRLSPVPLEVEAPLNFPSADGVNAVALVANTAKSITIPAGAAYVRLVPSADIFMKANGTATVPGDTSDGTASELVRYQGSDDVWRSLAGVSSLSVITAAAGGAIVTATFYTT